MKRFKESSKKRRKTFGKNAVKTHKRNIPHSSMRGGIRL